MHTSCVRIARFVALVITLALASAAAAAPVNQPNATCRNKVASSSNKLGSTAMKAFGDCVRTHLFDPAGNCSTLVAADQKGKVPYAVTKLVDGIDHSCHGNSASVALDEHVRCGPPLGTPVTSFAELAACMSSLVKLNVEDMHSRILDPNFSAVVGDIRSCVSAISKGAVRLFKEVQKEKLRYVRASDDLGGDSSYIDPGDPGAKIARARTQAEDRIVRSCTALTPADWAAVGSCANDLAGVIDCVLADVEAVAGGLVASAYDEPGVCPSELSVTFRGGAQGSAIVSPTDIDYGHTGFAHNTDFTDGTALRLDLDCGAPTDNSCALCTVSSSCAEGNCRCENDNSLVCNEPFGPDADDCSGNPCEMFFGPPLPVPAGSLPFCLVSKIDQATTGLSSPSSGELALEVALQSFAHITSFASDNPCPRCESGFCDGGERDGLACSVDAASDFGDVSYDCPPDAASNITPLGMRQSISLSTSASTLPLALPCDPPLGAIDCACSACTGDLTLACNSDVECSDAGAGTCMTSGAHGGGFRVPHMCNDGICHQVGGEEGRCTAAGPEYLFCDGFLKGNGDGVITCIDDNDCAAAAVGFDAGLCTLEQSQPCFLAPIDAVGASGLGDPVLAAAFCMPPAPTGLGGFGGAAGVPGPARMTLATHVLPYCADGVTPWGVGGANCGP